MAKFTYKYSDPQAAFAEAENRIAMARRGQDTVLDLSGLGLTTLPESLWQLTALQTLFLHNNQLAVLPESLGRLTALQSLYLSNNQLAALPESLGRLTALQTLPLSGNQLAVLPEWLGRLTALQSLSLNNNQLAALPESLDRLTALQSLYLANNQLAVLPESLDRLTKLLRLDLSNNPLQDPPQSVCEQGIAAIQKYFADKATSGTELLWRSKLLLVGQGRIGKTELRHRLMNRPHGQAASTEVVEIETVRFPHPRQAGVTMELLCWDFGGQDIYHATHQFFLTGRSLFVFCFEAGKDWEAGKPYYWLDKISAVAPEAPVVIVATKADERPAPALPWEDLKKRYPQLVGHGCFTITTKEKKRQDQPGDGIAELVACLCDVAADRSRLPLMGESLPKSWVAGMNAVAQHQNEHYLRREDFCQLLRAAKVPEASGPTVAMLLRDLGEILYYSEDHDAALHDWVIIKPTWVTRAAARILDSADVQQKDGILTQEEMSRAWRSYPDAMHPVLLDLLEKYDLTYKIPDDRRERSLVVEKLPKTEAAAPGEWEALRPVPGGPNRQMKMTFHLGSIQAGIPTWFMARKHHHTLHKHWLYGVYFGDNRKTPRHVALVRASTDPKRPEVELTVCGPLPQTFFAVMREGLEASIRDRYPHLIERQTIPCSCQDAVPGENRCGHSWEISTLEDMFQANVSQVRCEKKPFKEVTIRQLLSGYDDPVASMQTELQKMGERIINEVQQVGEKVEDLAAQVRENFRYLFDDLQQREESHCPPLFVIWKAAQGKPFHVPLRLALVCQHSGQEHIACPAADAYKIDALKEQLRRAAPLLKHVRTVLKYARLTGLSALKEWDQEIGAAVGDFQETLNELLADFEKLAEKGDAPKLLERDIDGGTGRLLEKHVAGAALREFRALLDQVDPAHGWHGLVKKRWNQTGEYLWVCQDHATLPEYQR